MLLVSGTRFAVAGISSSRSRHWDRIRRSKDTKQRKQAAELARLNSELESTTIGSAMQWRVMEVAEIVDESADCKSFYLVDPYGQPLPDFRPGQYLMVRPALAGAYQTTRCYSLSSSPDSRFWRISVKRQQEASLATSGARDGGLSAWLHDTIGEGDCLLIGGPSGQFFLPDESNRPLVLLAAGIGITPMASMLRWSLQRTPNREVTLLYQVKDQAHWPLGATLHSWQEKFDTCDVRSFFSRVDESAANQMREEMPGSFSVGRLDSKHAVDVSYANQADFYMCGPDSWMTSIREGLVEHGISPDRVHWESFGGVGAQPTEAKSGSAQEVSVCFKHSDVTAQWSDPEQSLWELARENDVEIPSGCLSGVCGCCRVKLLKGEVEYDREISIELADDECLACVARPRSELAIDA